RFSPRLCVSAVMILFSIFAVYAQKETPPPGGQPKPFVFPKQDTYTLPNGMKVTMVQYGTIPKVAVQAIVHAGHINEKAEQNWISDMTSTLLKEGTTTRSAEQIAREMAEMGGSIFTAAATDSTTRGGEVLSEFDTRFITLLSDVLLNPKFAADDMEKIRANKIREVSIAHAQANNQAYEKFRQVIFGNHPYGSMHAEEETLKGYKLDDVKAFYNNEYGAARTHLYIVGEFDQAKVKAAIEQAFGKWRKGPDAIRLVPKIDARPSL